MQAVILVGGQGTRLRPLTATRPKPMMPLVDRPFVAHQIEHLTRYGIHDVVFSCGYRPDALEAYFGDGARFGVRVRYVTDPIPLGTAGAGGERGAGLRSSGRCAGPQRRHPHGPRPGGLPAFTRQRRRGRQHRPDPGHRPHRVRAGAPARGPGGVRVPRETQRGRAHPRRALPDQCGDLHLVPGGDRDDPVRSRLVRSNASSSRNWPSRGACSGIRATPTGGTLARPSPIWMPTATCWPARSRRAPTSSATPTVGRGTIVEETARVADRSCVGAECVIAAGAQVLGSVVGAHSRVGEDADIEGCVIGEGVDIGAGARLEGLVVVGDRAPHRRGRRRSRGPR